jgi:hypothetical protein
MRPARFGWRALALLVAPGFGIALGCGQFGSSEDPAVANGGASLDAGVAPGCDDWQITRLFFDTRIKLRPSRSSGMGLGRASEPPRSVRCDDWLRPFSRS